MPLVHLVTNAPLTAETKQTLAARLSRLAAGAIHKPETYVMAAVAEAAMVHAGTEGLAAFVEVRSIGGLGSGVCKALSEQVCALLGEMLGVPGERVYLNFTEVPASKWGHDGGTFG